MDVTAMEGTSKGSRNPLSVARDTLRQMRRDDAATSASAKQSAITAADNTSVPFTLPAAEEDALVAQVRGLSTGGKAKKGGGSSNSSSGSGGATCLIADADDFWIRACLRARKGDVVRAHALLGNYLRWRHDVHYDETSSSDKVRTILSTGLLNVVGNVTRDGRPILTVRYRFFNPREFAAIDVARAVGVVVEYLLRTYPAAQSHGVVVMDDMVGFSFGNFDFRVVRFLERAFTQVMPMRLAAIHVVNPGWVVRTIFSLMAGIMSKKIQARVHICEANNAEKLGRWLEKSEVPEFLNLGGTRQWSPQMLAQYVDRMMDMRKSVGPATMTLQ